MDKHPLPGQNIRKKKKKPKQGLQSFSGQLVDQNAGDRDKTAGGKPRQHLQAIAVARQLNTEVTVGPSQPANPKKKKKRLHDELDGQQNMLLHKGPSADAQQFQATQPPVSSQLTGKKGKKQKVPQAPAQGPAPQQLRHQYQGANVGMFQQQYQALDLATPPKKKKRKKGNKDSATAVETGTQLNAQRGADSTLARQSGPGSSGVAQPLGHQGRRKDKSSQRLNKGKELVQSGQHQVSAEEAADAAPPPPNSLHVADRATAQRILQDHSQQLRGEIVLEQRLGMLKRGGDARGEKRLIQERGDEDDVHVHEGRWSVKEQEKLTTVVQQAMRERGMDTSDMNVLFSGQFNMKSRKDPFWGQVYSQFNRHPKSVYYRARGQFWTGKKMSQVESIAM